MSVVMKVDCYQVLMPESTTETFAGICSAVSAMSGRRRNFAVPNAIIRLHKIFVDGILIEGDLVRLRMDSLPAKGDLDGKIDDIDFAEDEGVAEQTAFLFDTRAGILLLQRNRSGVGGTNFCKYFGDKGGVSDGIGLLPVVKREAMRRLAQFQEVQKIQIGIAKPVGNKIVQTNSGSLSAFLSTMDRLQAPYMTVECSVGRTREALSLKTVIDMARDAMRLISGAESEFDAVVQKLIVNGRNQDDDKEELDIIKDRVIYKTEIDPGDNRRLKYGVRRAAVKKAWEDLADEIEAYVNN